MILSLKKQVLIILLILSFILIFSCTQKQKKELKHFKSNLIGLKRVVTLYDCNGHIIKQWKGRFKIEINGAYISFIDSNGKEVKVSGTVVVQEQ